MKNRKLILIVSLVLAMTMSLGGTMAYLQDTDSDVNTMTLGNVKIEQLEYERVVDENGAWVSTNETDKYGYTPDKVQEFSQGLQLVPAVFQDGNIKWDDRANGEHQQSWDEVGASGSNQLFDDSVKNAHDKFVFVKNTGNTNAYVRTLFAFEMGSYTTKEEFDKVIGTNENDKNGESHEGHWAFTDIGVVEIEGNNYFVREALYLGAKSLQGSVTEGILAKDTVSYPSLLQVYMLPECDNDEVEAIDGNKNGTYDILVLSQAVQADGFANATAALNAAFPYEPEVEGVKQERNVTIAKWFNDEEATGNMTKVFDDTEIADVKAAIAAGEDKVVLGSGTFTAADFGMNNSDVVIAGTKDTVIDVAGTPNLNGSNVTFEGVTISGTTDNYKGLQHSGKITYKNCVFNNAMHLYGTEEVFEDCTFNLTTNYIWTYGAGKVTFKNCTFNTQGKAILIYTEDANHVQEVTIDDCVFNATASGYAGGFSKQPCAAVEIDSSLVKNGSYTVNVNGTNVVDSDFCGLVRIKKIHTTPNVTINGATAVPTIVD